MANPNDLGITGAEDTLADDPHAATMADPAAGLGAPTVADGSASSTVAAYARGQTVLPSVEFEAGGVRLVRSERPRYEMRSKLGEGGVGEVVRAHDNDIGRGVAIKRLRQNQPSTQAIARFVEEVRVTGRLEHPNIVTIHDVGVDEDGYFFVMRHVEGETLEQIIDKMAAGDAEYLKHYGVERRLEIFKGVLEAIAFAHSKGVIHRDIKPSNVMVGKFGEVTLLDWGIAKAMTDEADGNELALLGTLDDGGGLEEISESLSASGRLVQTHAGALLGTPIYMSPEQALGQPLDERSDVYSLCVMLRELLYLEHPIQGVNNVVGIINKVVHEEVSRPLYSNNPHQGTVPADLTWFIAAGVSKDPDKRYPSVRAMIERLDRRAEGDIPVQCHVTFARRSGNALVRVIETHPRLYTATLILALLAVVGGIVITATNL